MFDLRHEPHRTVPSNGALFWHEFKRSASDVAGLYILIALLLVIYVLPYIIPTDPFSVNTDIRLLPPSWIEGGMLEHFLGTDELGRDYLSRILLGAANTLNASLITVLAAVAVGVPIGLLSAISKHRVRSSVMHHLFDIMLSIPSLLIALVTIAILGPSLSHAILGISISLVPRFIHSTYYAVQVELAKDYITSDLLDGVSYLSLARHTILPNIASVIIQNFHQALGVALLDISAMGFLGFGAQPPYPDLGNMMASGLDIIYVGLAQAMIPGLAIMLIIISINAVGHGINRVLEIGIKKYGSA